MNRTVYRYLLNTYGRNPLQWVGFIAEIIRILIARIYVVVLMAQITTQVAAGNFLQAQHQTLLLLYFFLAASVIGTLGELLSTHAENNEYGRLAMRFYQRIINKDLSFYRDNQTGYLATVYRQHLDSAMHLVRFFRGEALATTLSITLPPIVLFSTSPKVGLIAGLVILVQVIYVLWSSSKINPYRERSHEIFRRITGEVSDVITNIIAFKSVGIEDRAHERMSNLIIEETVAFTKRRTLVALFDFPRGIITVTGVSTAIYFIVSHASAATPAHIGLLVMTINYMFQIVRNVSGLPELISQHDDLITKIHPTLRYLSTDNETIRDPEHPVPLIIKDGAIRFNHVGFRYPSHLHDGVKIPIFHDFTLDIRGGEQVGIVGLSGAGKSTLANLLMRFDDVEEGSIEIDGIDIRTVKQSELRQNIAYVPQEPLLFHRTIRENIAYYQEHKNESEVVAAAKAAHAYEFIDKLPGKFDTIVGERGVKLSGGQKQRVAIARAILKKAPIVVFDEATSALDSESEQIIQRALPEIIGRQTAIVIAHRLSTVAGLSRIIVMHEGDIVESGTHTDLLALRGRYYSLWQKQTAEFAKISQ